VGVQTALKKDRAKDIDLVVHQLYAGQSSPCVVIKDGDRRGIGRNIETIEEIFELEVGKHPGYTVQRCVPIELEAAEN
jgi:hypothetical protein